jgi:DNA-binding NarL/FixJ family response regulator
MTSETNETQKADVLIITGRDQWRPLLREFLTVSLPGRTILEAEQRFGALEIAARYRPRLALVWHQAPHFNGIEVTAHIRSLLIDTKVILITGNDDDHLVATALAAGAFACVREERITTDLLPLVKLLLGARLTDASPGGLL